MCLVVPNLIFWLSVVDCFAFGPCCQTMVFLDDVQTYKIYLKLGGKISSVYNDPLLKHDFSVFSASSILGNAK